MIFNKKWNNYFVHIIVLIVVLKNKKDLIHFKILIINKPNKIQVKRKIIQSKKIQNHLETLNQIVVIIINLQHNIVMLVNLKIKKVIHLHLNLQEIINLKRIFLKLYNNNIK